MKFLKLNLFVLLWLLSTTNAWSRDSESGGADDVVSGQIISHITNFDGVITIDTLQPIINPDSCSNPVAYIVSVTQSRFNQFQLPDPQPGNPTNTIPARDYTGAGTLINMLGNTNHGGDPTFPVNMTVEELLPLRIDEVPVEFRVEGCLRGFPVIRWLAF